MDWFLWFLVHCLHSLCNFYWIVQTICYWLVDCISGSDVIPFEFLIVKVKSITTSSSSKGKTTTSTRTRVREKKVFTFPGQKYDPPEEVAFITAIFTVFIWKEYFVETMCLSFFFSFSAFCVQREPLRIFYESLSKQIPSSEMAEFWWVLLLFVTAFPFLISNLGSYELSRTYHQY